MSPLPVIADVYRMTLNWNPTGGITAHNVLHFSAPAGNEEDVFDVFNSNFNTNMIAPIATDNTINSIDVIKLDGVSAQVTFSDVNPIDGQGAGEVIPASAAVLSLHTSHRGPRARGRLFLGPTTEGNTSQGVYGDGPLRAAVVDAWRIFAGTAHEAGIDMGVASYVHADFNPVEHFSMRIQVGTMRRRQNQLLH